MSIPAIKVVKPKKGIGRPKNFVTGAHTNLPIYLLRKNAPLCMLGGKAEFFGDRTLIL